MTQMGLTPRMRQMLYAIQEYQREHPGESPSHNDLRQRLGVSSTSVVHRLLNSLTERGYVSRLPLKARSLVLLDGQEPQAAHGLPPALVNQLLAFCAINGERPEAVIADAVALHLDAVEQIDG